MITEINIFPIPIVVKLTKQSFCIKTKLNSKQQIIFRLDWHLGVFRVVAKTILVETVMAAAVGAPEDVDGET